MPKQRVVADRRGWLGGLNSVADPLSLNPDQVYLLHNTHIDESTGAISCREGSIRLHQTALSDEITGLYQWNNAGTLQLVATCADGDMYHKTTDFGAFTQVSPTPALDTELSTFTTMRDDTSGAPLVLYFSDGTQLWKWTGSALTQIDGVSNLPGKADIVTTYHLRNFIHDPDYPSHVFWTVLGDPEDGTVGLGNQGGSAMVDVLRGEAITAMERIGSSLLIGTKNSLSRFTGFDNADIRIAQDTEGVSSNVGPAGPNCLRRIEDFAAMISTSGIYLVSETDIVPISGPIQDLIRATNRSEIEDSTIAFLEKKRQIWFFMPGTLSGQTTIKDVYVYSLDLQKWVGRYEWAGSPITCATSWEDSTGAEYIITGHVNGYVVAWGWEDAAQDFLEYNEGTTGAITLQGRAGIAPVQFPEAVGQSIVLDEVFGVVGNPGDGSGPVVSMYIEEDRVLYASEYGSETSQGSFTASTSTDTRVLLTDRIQLHVKGAVFAPFFTMSAGTGNFALHAVSLHGWAMGRPAC